MGLPEAANAVPVEKRFVRHQNEVARKRLGHEHSVKWVAVGTGQRTSAHGVLDCDWQFFKILSSHISGHVEE